MPKEGNMSTGIMIIGPSGSGKTTLGKVVAEKLGYSISRQSMLICVACGNDSFEYRIELSKQGGKDYAK